MDLPKDLAESVRLALAEDIGSGDLTAALIPVESKAEASIICREPAVICGRPWFDEVFHQLDRTVVVAWLVDEGERVEAGQEVCRISGSSRALLTGERSALNFLQTLSGTATEAARYAEAVAGFDVKVLDTRKTIPGMRNAQKYAVACGGCFNHRHGLYDGVLIKENHILAAGSIKRAVEKVRPYAQGKPIEVEVENLDELQQVLTAQVDIVMLDNFSIEQIHEAVSINNGRVKLEVSGNVTLESIVHLAQTGVDYISTGAITKHLHAIDFSMRFS